jgi:Family of unknown function (DUF5670)
MRASVAGVSGGMTSLWNPRPAASGPTALNLTLAFGVHLTDAGRITMLIGLFFILLVMWAMGFFAFHVAGALIHLLLLFALISLVMHLFTARTI